MDVLRYDNGRLGKATRTSQGFLRVPARVTRTGVFAYTQDDGSTVHELRHPDDVFNPDSVASLASAPVTDLHPPTPVTAENAGQFMVGFGSESPARDGQYLASPLTLTDADVIAKTDSGQRKEISLGYTCKIVPESGVYQGERYDQRQTQIRYNHIAIGPSGWGRAGSAVSMRLDGGAARFDDSTDSVSQEACMDTVEIRIDGAGYTVPKTAVETFTKLDATIAQLRKDAADASGKLGAAETALAQVKADLAAAKDDKAVAARVDARIALVTDARKVLGDTYKVDGKSDAEVMKDAVAKARPEMKLDSVNDAWIAGAFRVVCDSVGTDSLKDARQETPVVTERADAKAARKARMDSSKDAWKTLGKKDGGK